MTETSTAIPTEREALDAYSTTVTSVAERVLPAVASLRVGRAGRGGAGSAGVITPDRFLGTSPPGGAPGGAPPAAFPHGTRNEAHVGGGDPLPAPAGPPAPGAGLEPARLGKG